MVVKIICIGLVTVITSSIVKHYRSDISLIINICGSMLIVLLCLDSVSQILTEVIDIGEVVDISQSVLKPLVKVLGIGYITEFCADVAEDAGNKTISSKIIFGGKIAICVVAFPIIINMLNAVLSLL